MIAAIWAESANRVIGRAGAIPWRYPGDLQRFKRVTLDSTVVMGRRTFESIGRPLPRRRNVILTRDPAHVSTVKDPSCEWLIGSGSDAVRFVCERAASERGTDLWFIGGAEVYAAAMPFCHLLDVTYVPDLVEGEDLVMAPTIDEALFERGVLLRHEDEPALRRRVFVRRDLPEAPYDNADNRRLQEAGTLRRRP